MRVLHRLQRRIPKVIQRISKRLQSVTLSDLFSKVTVPVLSKSQTRILQSSKVNRHSMLVMVSHGLLDPGLRYTSDYSIWARSRSSVIWMHFILRGSLLSHFRQQFYVRGSYPFIWNFFFRTNCTQNHVVYVEGQSSQQISQCLGYHDR